MIRLETITLGYGSRTLVEKADAEIRRGALTALLGRNGTGKSTLLRAVAGMQSVMAGRILIAGRAAEEYTPERMALTVAMVTTERIRVADLRCRDVVALGRAPYTNWIGRMQDADAEIVERSLATVGMSAYADRTMDRMSDGECQRVMIARALAQDTPVILLDEPTAFLDLPNRYALALLLRKLAREERKCILFSTHDLDIALSLCDSVALIDTPHLHHLPAGEMVRSGLIERLFAGEGLCFDPRLRSVRMRGE